jgi:FkbM family methyltransferase
VTRCEPEGSPHGDARARGNPFTPPIMIPARRLAKSNPLLRFLTVPAVRAIRRIMPPANVLLARSYAQLFNAVEAGSLIVGMPDFLGSFEIDCHSDVLRCIMIHGGYEPDLVRTVKGRIDPGRDAIDVGANVGLFTVLMCGLLSASRRVLAIEPTPGALQYLHKNLHRNHCAANTIVFEGAATRMPGELTINVIPGMEEYSSIAELVHPAVKGRPMERIRVAGDTIDDLVERLALRPGIIKIDTEGAEFDVLSGASKTMARHRPVIVCECWPDSLAIAAGGNPGAVTHLLRRHGYDVLDREDYLVGVPAPAIALKAPPVS